MPNFNPDKIYMNIANEISKMSYANRLQVGAILVKDHSIISYGYNGMPYNFPNECETNNITNIEVLHAESNAIAKIAKSPYSSENSSIYVTTSPCIECAKLIIQSGITSVYFDNLYRNIDGLKLLIKANIKVFKLVEKNSNFFEIYRIKDES